MFFVCSSSESEPAYPALPRLTQSFLHHLRWGLGFSHQMKTYQSIMQFLNAKCATPLRMAHSENALMQHGQFNRSRNPSAPRLSVSCVNHHCNAPLRITSLRRSSRPKLTRNCYTPTHLHFAQLKIDKLTLFNGTTPAVQPIEPLNFICSEQ